MTQVAPKEGDVYVKTAQGMCDCVNQSTADLSQRMIDIIIDAAGDQQKLEEAVFEYASEDQEAVERDVEVMNGSMMNEMVSCFERVKSDYEDIYRGDSENEAEAKIVEAMRSLDGCEVAVGFFELGVANSEESDKSETTNDLDATNEITNDSDNNMNMVASQVCSCISNSAEPMSDRMAQIFIESKGDPVLMEELIQVYTEEDMENARKDAELLQGQIPEDIEKCISRLESEYDDLFEDEMLESLLQYLDEMPDCKLSVAIIELGLNMD